MFTGQNHEEALDAARMCLQRLRSQLERAEQDGAPVALVDALRHQVQQEALLAAECGRIVSQERSGS